MTIGRLVEYIVNLLPKSFYQLNKAIFINKLSSFPIEQHERYFITSHSQYFILFLFLLHTKILKIAFCRCIIITVIHDITQIHIWISHNHPHFMTFTIIHRLDSRLNHFWPIHIGTTILIACLCKGAIVVDLTLEISACFLPNFIYLRDEWRFY